MNFANTMQLKDALRLMDRLDHKSIPVPFSVTFYTADRRRGTGGEKKTISGAILSKHNKFLPQHVRRVDGFGGSRKARHYENATRNIQSPDGEIIKVHIRLITAFNNSKVIW
ncbi:hypothetical protein [Belliella pelovolcani]|uniref:hypothetical protein n=1 Tax=Belliella pelovolcani TaxID=529505 RepID=UPI00391DA667